MARHLIRLLTVAVVVALAAGAAPAGAALDGGAISRTVEATADENYEFAAAFDVEVIEVTGDVDFDASVVATATGCRWCEAFAAGAFVVVPRTAGVDVQVGVTAIATTEDCTGDCEASASVQVVSLDLADNETAFLNPLGWVLVEIADAKARLAERLVTSIFFAGFAKALWNSATSDIVRVLDSGITIRSAPAV